MLKKRRELFDGGVSKEKLKIRNLKLYNDGVKVQLDVQNAHRLRGFLHILQLNTGSLVNIERRSKFVNALINSDYNDLCLCETWLNDNIQDSELFLNNYNIYRTDRATIGDKNAHEVTLIAVKNTLISEKINSTLPNSCVACKIILNGTQVFLYAFYNPPISSSYRYTIEDFQLLLRNIPKNEPIAICGDLNFPANWKTLYSPNKTEGKVFKILEEKLFRQIIDFPTCGNNILDTALYQNCHLSAELDKSFPSIYNLTDHETIRLSLENPVSETKPLIQNFRSFGNADNDGVNEHLVEKPFQSICYNNINKMSEEFTWYLDAIFDL